MPKSRHPYRTITIEGRKLKLSPREYEILKLLEARDGEPISAEEIERQVTDEVLGHAPGNWTRSHIQRLRDRLQEEGVSRFRTIRNTYGKGYYLVKMRPDGTLIEQDANSKE